MNNAIKVSIILIFSFLYFNCASIQDKLEWNPEIHEKIKTPFYIIPTSDTDTIIKKISFEILEERKVNDEAHVLSPKNNCTWDIKYELSNYDPNGFEIQCPNESKRAFFLKFDRLSVRMGSNNPEIKKIQKYFGLVKKEKLFLALICKYTDKQVYRGNAWEKLYCEEGSESILVYTKDLNFAQEITNTYSEVAQAKIKDIETIKSISDFDVEKYQSADGDNAFQKEEKEKQKKIAFKNFLKKMKGKTVKFEFCRLESVEQEEKLTEAGKKKIQEDSQEFRQNAKNYGLEYAFHKSLNSKIYAECHDCKIKLNSYIATYNLSDPEGVINYRFSIKVRYKSREDILGLKIGSAYKVSGKIISLELNGLHGVYRRDITSFIIDNLYLE